MNLKKRFIGIVTFVSSDSEPSVVIVILCRYNDCRYIDCSYSDSDPIKHKYIRYVAIFNWFLTRKLHLKGKKHCLCLEGTQVKLQGV